MVCDDGQRRQNPNVEGKMKTHSVLTVTVFLLAVCVSAEAMERIDDMTILQDGELVDFPVVEHETSAGHSSTQQDRGMNDGFVFCSGSDDAYPFDLTTHTPGASIAGYNYPYDAMLNPQGTEVWVADASLDAVVVLDRSTNTVSHTIPVGDYPTGIAFSGDGSFAMVAVARSDKVSLINATTYAVEDSITEITGQSTYGPGFITYCPGNDRFYLAQWYEDGFYEISSDGTQILQETTLGSDLWQLVCSHDGTTLYILDRGPDVVRFFDVGTFSEVTSVSVGTDPWGIDITPDDSKLVIGCEDSHELYICDTVTQQCTPISLSTQNDPRDVDISEDGTLAYIPAGPDEDHVLILDIAGMVVTDSIAPTGASTTNSVSVAPQMGPAVSEIELTGEIVGGQVQLSWSAVDQASAYWVYGTSNMAWFDPGFAPGYEFRLAVLPPATTTWSSANGVGDPNANWTYLVMAVDASEQELARSNRAGEHDFEADIP
jgi:YVTN family beta-propeller protein